MWLIGDSSKVVGSGLILGWRNTPTTQSSTPIARLNFERFGEPCPSSFQLVALTFKTRPCRSRQCPPCRGADYRVDRSSANDRDRRCSCSGYPHQPPGYQDESAMVCVGPPLFCKADLRAAFEALGAIAAFHARLLFQFVRPLI